MNDLDVAYLFRLPPEKAIEYLELKGLAITFDWYEMRDAAHAGEFTVAKAMRLDILQEIKGALVKSLAEGETLKTFQKQITPELQRLGWWGRQEVLNEGTGELRMAQLGSPYRLETIYQANMQSSYMAGRWQSQWENRDNRPYLMLVAVLDGRTRPAHRAYNGLIARIDAPIWRYLYPPNGWRCRCRVRALTHAQAIEMVKNGEGVWVKDDGLSFKDVEIPHSGGETGQVAVYKGVDILGNKYSVSPDLGWSSNPGLDRWQPDPRKYSTDIAALLGGKG